MKTTPLYIAFTILLLSACSTTKSLKSGEFLYKNHSLNISFENGTKNKSFVSGDIASQIGPNPNRKFLGVKARLMIYNFIGETKKDKGMWYSLRNNFGEPPVIWNEDYPERVIENIKSKALSLGFSNSIIDYKVKQSRKKVRLVYNVNLSDPLIIKKVSTQTGNSELSDSLQKIDLSHLINTQLNVQELRDTKKSIEKTLKNQGFYFFSQEAIFFDADTNTLGNNQVVLKLKLDPKKTDPKAYFSYKINTVTAYTDFTTDSLIIDTSVCNKNSYIRSNLKYKPAIILDHLYLSENDKYSNRKHLTSLQHLSKLGCFESINANVTVSDTNQHLLDIKYNLKSALPKKFETKVTFASKSDGFIGPSIENSITNKNVFNGAESFTFRTELGYETQLNNNYSVDYTLSLALGIELMVPRLVVPFRVKSREKDYLPTTSLNLDYSIYMYDPLFLSQSIGPSLEYKWMNNKNILYEFTPILINYRHNTPLTDDSDDLEDLNPYFNNLQDRLIIGGEYHINLHSKETPNRKNHYYWRTGFDVSGNIVQATYSAEQKKVKDKTLIGVPFAQFIRFESEPHFKKNLSKNSDLAIRLITNIGYPYGNSTELPYFKQYAIGGPYSIRAFLSKTIGPGTFIEESSESDFLLHTGEIYLENNIEYRRKITRTFETAVFIDAGNVWLVNENETRPGGEFTDKFYEQIAVGTGFGGRLNLDFIVIRLDLGIPLRLPQGWVINKFDLTSPTWRNQNLILNFAIGYPF